MTVCRKPWTRGDERQRRPLEVCAEVLLGIHSAAINESHDEVLMTIGIGAAGPRAGAAVLEALRAVESVARGEIGGFATFAVITLGGAARIYTTQRGGSTGLRFESHEHAPEEVLNAPLAGVISSGPDRPQPLERFVAVDAGCGLVTGHRSPDALGAAGIPLNRSALELLRSGNTPREAVDRVMDANLHSDCGLIIVDLAGRVAARDSARVAKRPDVGATLLSDSGIRATVAVLHNAIQPTVPLADLAAHTAVAAMAQWWPPDLWLTVEAGVPVAYGTEDAVEVNDSGEVVSLRSSDTALFVGDGVGGACPYLGATVYRNGRKIGVTTSEGYVVVSDGTIRSIAGRSEHLIGCRMIRGGGES